MSTILFICTGNIFRSMIAEYALKAALGPTSPHTVRSAGIQANQMAMYEPVRERLIDLGIDPSEHQQTQLTADILDAADLGVAMGFDHQLFVRSEFDREIPLFKQVCFGRDEPVLDVGEAMPNWKDDPDVVADYTRTIADEIWSAMPDFISRMTSYTR